VPNLDQVNVQNRMAQAQPNLPPEVTQFGMTMRKVTGLPMMVLGFFSPHKSYEALFLSNYANINVVDALYRVPGVGEVRTFGTGDYAMRIWLKPDRLASMGITVPEVATAVRQQSAVNPAGQLGGQPAPSGQDMTFTVRAAGRLTTPQEFGDIVVRSSKDGSVVHLRDVARVELGAANYQQMGRVKGQPGVGIAVFQAPGSNALEVAKGVRQVMNDLRPRFPKDIDYTFVLDTTLPVSEGIKEILITFLEAMILVTFVVFLFLQNWRATMIPMLAVPVSLIGTFVVFPLLGFSVNTLSLFGLVLAIGLVVDDAIVVVEAVEHHIEQGLDPKAATRTAMREVSGPVVGIALVLASVFLPVGLMSGIQGRLNQQFAITIAISVIISAFNALTLSPALASLLLRPRRPGRGLLRGAFDRFNRALERATNGYVSLSHGIVRKPLMGIAVLAIFFVVSGFMTSHLPTSFLPEEDYGYLLLNIQLPPAASLERTDAVSRKVDQILLKREGVKDFNTIVGFSLITRVTASNNAFYFVRLAPWDERRAPELSARAIVDSLNREFRATIPEATVFAAMPPSIPGLGQQGGFSFWLQDRSGGSIEFLDNELQKFLAAARKRPELAGVSTTLSARVPQIYSDVDREKVLAQGVALGDVYQTMQTYLGGLYVNQFNRFGRQWRVFLQAEGSERMTPGQVGQFYVRNDAGAQVPLSALQSTKPTVGPMFTNRFNIYRAAQITGAAAPGYSSGQAIAALEDLAQKTLGPEFSHDWSDLSYQEKKASGGASLNFALSLIFVFLILAALYESWWLPFAVLLTVPVAIFGASLGLIIRHFDLDVYGQIGIVMLIGLAAKNAILIVEFAKYRLEEGRPLVEAALEGARVRLRPILMTSFAFILGCVPLWTATGSGSAARRILGTVVISGMLSATLIAIFLIPSLFVIFEGFAERLQARRAGGQAVREAAAAAEASAESVS
jgi:HAE1 family hydrophobic/amphiphilic exporter-1